MLFVPAHNQAQLNETDWPDWSNDVCAVIAGGASVARVDVASLRGRCKVAVVNNSHMLAPWADALYAADEFWWENAIGLENFSGLKFAPAKVDAKRYGLKSVDLIAETDTDMDKFSMERKGLIARGGNSAFQLVNLVTQFGAKKQIWIGFDFVGDHWHSRHKPPLRNPRPQTLQKWAERFDKQKPLLDALGVSVINASDVSALQAYPKATLCHALKTWLL